MNKNKLMLFFKKESVFVIACILAIISCFFVNPSYKYFDYINWETLIILFVMMVIVQILYVSGIFDLIVFLSITFSTFCFDYNKDNFSVGLDMETGLFVYKDKIYILGWDGKLWSDKRPEKIVNEFGYPGLHIKENPYYGNFVKKLKGTYFLDLNGEIISINFFDNNYNTKETKDLFKNVYGGIKNIKASSELTETLNNNKTVYSVENILTVGSEKETGYFFRTIGCPWVPDIKIDKNFIGENINYIYENLPDDEKYLWDVRNELLKKSSDFSDSMEARLYEYFVFRHIPDALYDGRLEGRIKLVERCFKEITDKWKSTDSLDEKIEIARAFSEDFEYDTDKIEDFLKKGF